MMRFSNFIAANEERGRQKTTQKPRETQRKTEGNCSRSFVLAAFALCLALSPVAPSQVPSGRDVVKPEIYTSLDPAARGSSFQIAVVMKIRPGFHVNAREKSEEYLVATDLKAAAPAGFSSGEVSYPKGKLEKFAVSKIPLNVYQDNDRDSSHACDGAGKRSSRRTAHSAEAPLPGLQQRTLPASGHAHTRRDAERRRFNLRSQARSRRDFWKAVAAMPNAKNKFRGGTGMQNLFEGCLL